MRTLSLLIHNLFSAITSLYIKEVFYRATCCYIETIDGIDEVTVHTHMGGEEWYLTFDSKELSIEVSLSTENLLLIKTKTWFNERYSLRLGIPPELSRSDILEAQEWANREMSF